MTDTALLDRLQYVEDKLEIYELKAAYCAACDDDHNPDSVCTLFISDGIWESPGLMTCHGPKEIHAFFSTMGPPSGMKNSAHMVMNPQISINGNKAKGHWRFLMMWTGFPEDNIPSYTRIIGTYEDDFVKSDGVWRFQHLRATVIENDVYPARPVAMGASAEKV